MKLVLIEAGREVASHTEEVVVQDWLIISLGDSAASGEGVFDVCQCAPAQQNRTFKDHCLLSGKRTRTAPVPDHPTRGRFEQTVGAAPGQALAGPIGADDDRATLGFEAHTEGLQQDAAGYPKLNFLERKGKNRCHEVCARCET